MIDRRHQVSEEPRQRVLVGGVEGRRAVRAEFPRRLVEPVLMAADEDGVGALGHGAPGRLQPDPGAAADHGDGLPGQARFAPGGPLVVTSVVTLVVTGTFAICASIGRRGCGMSLMFMTRHCTAAL